jgi:hypothetical protein
MSRIPPEPVSWTEDVDPDEAARTLREQLKRAKARMQEHREQMHAAGLTRSGDSERPKV